MAGVDGLGIEQVTSQITEAITTLRTTAQAVLTVAPLPDALRPPVEQLIPTIEAIDLPAAIEQPVKRVLDQLRLPDGFSGSLEAVVDRRQPGAERGHRRDPDRDQRAARRAHAPAPRRAARGITELLRSVASVLDGLDAPVGRGALRGPFNGVLAAVDAVEPTSLLKPVIDAFDKLLGAVSVPDPATGAARVSGVLTAAGESAGQALIGPFSHLLPAGSTSFVPPLLARVLRRFRRFRDADRPRTPESRWPRHRHRPARRPPG